MGNCYLTDRIAVGNIHTDTTCKIEELQQKERVGTVSDRLLGIGDRLLGGGGGVGA